MIRKCLSQGSKNENKFKLAKRASISNESFHQTQQSFKIPLIRKQKFQTSNKKSFKWKIQFQTVS